MSDIIVKCVCQHCQRVTVVPQETIRTLLSEAEQREKEAKRVVMEALKPFAEYKTADGYDGTNFLRIKDAHPVLFKDLGSSKPAVVIGDFRKARELFDALQSEER